MTTSITPVLVSPKNLNYQHRDGNMKIYWITINTPVFWGEIMEDFLVKRGILFVVDIGVISLAHFQYF